MLFPFYIGLSHLTRLNPAFEKALIDAALLISMPALKVTMLKHLCVISHNEMIIEDAQDLPQMLTSNTATPMLMYSEFASWRRAVPLSCPFK